jgi:hypothetical protein
VAYDIFEENDILPDGNPCGSDCDGLELVTGNKIYAVNLSTNNLREVSTAGIPDGLVSIGDMDNDQYTDIITVQGGRVYVWNPRTGAEISNRLAIAGRAGRANIADIDNDGFLEVTLASANRFAAIDFEDSDNDGILEAAIKWQNSNYDQSSACTGSTVFDLNGDGSAEVIYRDERFLYIYNGETGDILQAIQAYSGTLNEYPIVIDVDKDGEAEIITAQQVSHGFSGSLYHTGFIGVYESATLPWVPTRSVWNQHSYHVTNINDDMTVPRYQQKNALPGYQAASGGNPAQMGSLNIFLSQPILYENYSYSTDILDISIRKERGCTNETKLTADLYCVSPNFSILWNTGEVTQDIVVHNAGMYSVTVTDECSGHSATAEIEVGLYQNLCLSPSGTTYGNTAHLTNVLAAGASTNSEAWLRPYASKFINNIPYPAQVRGQQGIWRSTGSAAFMASRATTMGTATSPTSQAPNLAKDGTFTLSMYNWEDRTSYVQAPQWRSTGEITHYNEDGKAVESRDALFRYSSALYGYYNLFPIATAANARVGEIGFESFEEFGHTVAATGEVASGQLDFLGGGEKDSNVLFQRRYTVTSGTHPESTSNSSTDNEHCFNQQPTYNEYWTTLAYLDTYAAYYKGSADIKFNTESGESYIGQACNLRLRDNTLEVQTFNTPQSYPRCSFNDYPNERWTGQVAYQGKSTLSPQTFGTGSFQVNNNRAHSGKQALEIKGKVRFRQKRMALEPLQSYYISLWVSANDTDTPDFYASSEAVQPNNPIGITISFPGIFETFTFYPTGPVIEGWQKIEGTFCVPAQDFCELRNYSPGVRDFFELTFESGFGLSAPTYFDDIRICPADGNIKTHVYDPFNYRLSATLDANNFATFYEYDEEGNLFQTKKETTKGIQTIQNVVGHMPVK